MNTQRDFLTILGTSIVCAIALVAPLILLLLI